MGDSVSSHYNNSITTLESHDRLVDWGWGRVTILIIL